MNSVGVSTLCFQPLHHPAPDSREGGIDWSPELHYKCYIDSPDSVEYQIKSDNNIYFFLSLFTLWAFFLFSSLAKLMQR